MKHKRLSESTGVFAGLATAIAVIVGYLAARATAKGLAKLTMMMHLTRPPLDGTPRAGPARGCRCACQRGRLLRFYSWGWSRMRPRRRLN